MEPLIELIAGDAAHGGWCVARQPDGRVVLIRHALPGERVLARITSETATFARAEAVEILEPSADRVQPPCPQARPDGCGGCDWQHATPDAQRRLKARVISQQLRRIAGIEREVTVEPLPGDERGLGWRTRVRFAVRPDGTPGLRKHRSHDVIEVDGCPIAHPLVDGSGALKARWPGASAVEVISAPGTDERAVLVTPARAPRRKGPARGARGGGGSRFAQWAEQVADPVLVIGGSGGLRALRGSPFVHQTAAGRDWRTSAGVFWQVHPAAADVLAAAVLAALDPQPGEVALDLYCGAGLFAGVLADAVGPSGQVIGVESDPAAVRDARYNLRGTPWARVHRGDVAEVLARGASSGGAGIDGAGDGGAGSDGAGGAGAGGAGAGGAGAGGAGAGGAGAGGAGAGGAGAGDGGGAGAGQIRADIVVLDPPRAGAARPVLDQLLAQPGPGGGGAGRPGVPAPSLRRVAYVSCDPATLARDLGIFLAAGWQLDELRAFDAFPMTHHVECLAVLSPGAAG